MRTDAEIEYGVLLCPECGTDYTHHRRVTVFWRDREDEPFGSCIRSSQDELSATRRQYGNPSARRDGISIDCRCEACKTLFRLHIAQHKGHTLIQTEVIAVGRHEPAQP